MLAITAVQVACSIAAVYFGAQVAMAYGRDLRAAIFHHVGTFSAHEVGTFGAPSLLTRSTNDVQQVQMLVLMGATMLVDAPIMAIGGMVMALREDLALSRLLLVWCRRWSASIGVIIGRMIPQFRSMQPKIDTINRVLREQITGVRVVRAFVREPAEAVRFDGANADLTGTALRVGKLQALMFPTVMLVFNTSNIAVLWFGAHRVADGRAGGRRADRVPQLPDADPRRGHDGDVHLRDDPARRGVRRADRRGARHVAVGGPAAAPVVPAGAARPGRAARRRVSLSGRRAWPC